MFRSNILIFSGLLFLLASFSLININSNESDDCLDSLGFSNFDLETEGQVMLIVKIKSNLDEEELLRRARERKVEFEALEGLVQKYYAKIGEGHYSGIYIWESKEAFIAYRDSDLAKTIPTAYEATEVSFELADFLFQLRD